MTQDEYRAGYDLSGRLEESSALFPAVCKK